MDNRNDIREFLVSRRARITPQQAGLIAYGRNRRVPGLRREEAAMLAGVSIDYYTQLERGKLTGVSDSVLDAIAGALQLDEAERAHLFDLARAANATPRTVGELSLAFEAMDLAADTGLTLTAYTAEPGSSSLDALKLLASWSATLDEAAASKATDGT